MSSAGLGDLLGGSNPVTLLAPSNAAFAALGESALADLKNPANVEQLTGLLKNHVVSGSLSADDLAKPSGLENVLGNSLPVAQGGSRQTTIGGANIIESMQGSNGFVHVIDKVLAP